MFAYLLLHVVPFRMFLAVVFKIAASDNRSRGIADWVSNWKLTETETEKKKKKQRR